MEFRRRRIVAVQPLELTQVGVYFTLQRITVHNHLARIGDCLGDGDQLREALRMRGERALRRGGGIEEVPQPRRQR